MGKHEKGTPKEIANRCKSKGLQKLRWYCEMCQKQCRDQNGYKCHLTSESHQRQLLLVAENTDKYVKEFSKEFEDRFMHILRNSYGTRRVRANEVYQEFIKDKLHTHMNSTKWHTLSAFVQYLGNTGKCKVDKNEEKGWYIQYIDKEEVVRREEEARKAKAEKDDEERQQQMLNERVQRALEQQGEIVEYKPTELIRADDEKISLNINLNKKPTAEELAQPTTSLGVSVFDLHKKKVKKEEVDDRERKRSRSRSRSRDRTRDHRGERSVKRERSRSNERRRGTERNRDSRDSQRGGRDVKPKKSALDDIREMNERYKEKNGRKDHWLRENIIVKVVTKKLGADYYKAKGVVKSIIDDYTASVKLDDGTLVKLDQSHVETVIPSVGREMLIVNGGYRGHRATLESIDEKKFSLNLRISYGLLKGREVQVPYEDASKLAS